MVDAYEREQQALHDQRMRGLAETQRMREALQRICSVHLDPPKITDPDWKARLMQGIAIDALNADT